MTNDAATVVTAAQTQENFSAEKKELEELKKENEKLKEQVSELQTAKAEGKIEDILNDRLQETLAEAKRHFKNYQDMRA